MNVFNAQQFSFSAENNWSKTLHFCLLIFLLHPSLFSVHLFLSVLFSFFNFPFSFPFLFFPFIYSLTLSFFPCISFSFSFLHLSLFIFFVHFPLPFLCCFLFLLNMLIFYQGLLCWGSSSIRSVNWYKPVFGCKLKLSLELLDNCGLIGPWASMLTFFPVRACTIWWYWLLIDTSHSHILLFCFLPHLLTALHGYHTG